MNIDFGLLDHMPGHVCVVLPVPATVQYTYILNIIVLTLENCMCGGKVIPGMIIFTFTPASLTLNIHVDTLAEIHGNT